jgi:hypothetical protein
MAALAHLSEWVLKRVTIVIAALNSATCHRLRASDVSSTFDLPQEMEVARRIAFSLASGGMMVKSSKMANT